MSVLLWQAGREGINKIGQLNQKITAERKRVRGTGFEPVARPLVDQEVTKDGTQDSTHEEILCSRVMEVWAFLPVELQRSIVSIVEQYVQLSLGRPVRPKLNTTTREQEGTET